MSSNIKIIHDTNITIKVTDIVTIVKKYYSRFINRCVINLLIAHMLN